MEDTDQDVMVDPGETDLRNPDTDGDGVEDQQFKPGAGEADVLSLHGPGVPGHLRWRAGVFLNYADDPLVLIDRADGSLITRLVDSQVGLDLLGAVGLGGSEGSQAEETPLEIQGALRYRINESLVATLGLGRGVVRGYGMPSFRLLGGLAWAEEVKRVLPKPPPADTDGDGLVDTEDRCPADPEDKDGFQDADGCADPDNDGDGIVDAKDKCPNEAEIINNIEDDDGCPDKGESKVRLQEDKIVILEKVYFASNKDVVLPRSFPLLQQVAAVLRNNPQIKKVRIEGHTDSRGQDAFNLDLSQRRTNTVRQYLLEQGIAAERMEAVGYGEASPVDTNDTPQGRENNRRVTFTILEMERPAQ